MDGKWYRHPRRLVSWHWPGSMLSDFICQSERIVTTTRTHHFRKCNICHSGHHHHHHHHPSSILTMLQVDKATYTELSRQVVGSNPWECSFLRARQDADLLLRMIKQERIRCYGSSDCRHYSLRSRLIRITATSTETVVALQSYLLRPNVHDW